MDMVTIFCDIDEFCRSLLATHSRLLPAPSGSKKSRGSSLSLSESQFCFDKIGEGETERQIRFQEVNTVVLRLSPPDKICISP
jgi:hypothetical protein